MFEPKFVITGTGRSGTGYIAALITAAGVPCGHEQWWCPGETQSLRLKGDASWKAAFALDDYPGHVFHQVRDPIRIINSLYSSGLTKQAWGYQLRAQHIGQTGDDLHDSINIAVTWTRQAQKVGEWEWRLEDVEADLLVEICRRAGFTIDRQRASAAIAVVSTDTNRHTRPCGPKLIWDDLPNSPLKAEAQAIARQYGYL